MITLSIPALTGFLALCSAGVGLAVLAIMLWRHTGQLDAAYDDGFDDGMRAGARPGPRHAAPAATLTALEPLPPVLPAAQPAASVTALPATDTGVQDWITSMRCRTDAWLVRLLADARQPAGALPPASAGG